MLRKTPVSECDSSEKEQQHTGQQQRYAAFRPATRPDAAEQRNDLLPTQPDDRGGIAYEKHRFQNRRFEKHSRKSEKRRLYTMPSRENRHATRLRPLVPTVSNARKSAAPERARNRPPTTRRTTARTRMPDPNRRRTSPSTRRGCKIEKTASARRIPAHKRPRPLPKIRYCALLP